MRDPAKPKRTMNVPTVAPTSIKKKIIEHEFLDFGNAYNIGILGYFQGDYEIQNKISEYKKKLEKLGFECEVLLFNNAKENDPKLILPSFCLADVNKEQFPNSLRTDRFMAKRFDLLLNLFFDPCKQLLYLAKESNARCRVSPYLDFVIPYSDIMIPITDPGNFQQLLTNINETLKLQPYVRPQI